ncbi:DNA cytosine methyltransferase [Undibacterium arcticum]|uniref:DNA cytosine methyltransferase n=1 Tax=Undibacterium arcticum TaxID=1762892 RepID=UPI00360EF99F
MNAIDLFAGAGGFSTGAQMAGCNVVWAANHWQQAVDTHAANHPDAQHVCQDLHQANWETCRRMICCSPPRAAKGTARPAASCPAIHSMTPADRLRGLSYRRRNTIGRSSP